ncbi:acyltransferase domain-containing protein [Streptomyces sp. NPDC087440]|uniref:acyltransferase domain-containing protein n=1 Tax=Streptomyces sp. NPDC087440 TaxID=3365790 RepID=UPI0037FC671B
MKDVREVLRGDAELAAWLDELEALEGPGFGAGLPEGEELPEVLLDLAVPHEDVNPLVALRRTTAEDPGWRWLLERCVHGLVRDMGVPGGGVTLPLLPALPEPYGAAGRYFAVNVFVAMLPHARAHHRALGISDEDSRRTLADLGRNMAVHRRRHGEGGLSVPDWIRLHFRGEIFQLGRLQFQRTEVLGRAGACLEEAGRPGRTGDPCLSIHVPDFSGPLSPRACAASLARARAFFPRHFPGERYEIAVCESWLLDPQLRDRLPEGSRILRFQDLFERIVPREEVYDTGTVRFVFGDPDLPVPGLPRRTSLERAVGDHLRAGGHWYGGVGTLTL